MRVHAHKLRAEQAGFVAARARAYLDNGVAPIVRILGQQKQPRLGRRLVQLGVQLRKLLARHFRHIGIVAVRHFLCFLNMPAQLAVGLRRRRQLLHVAVLAHQLLEQRRIGNDLGQRNSN